MAVKCGTITAPTSLPASVTISPGGVPKLVHLFTSLQTTLDTFDGEIYYCQLLACNDGTPTLVNDDLKARWDTFWSASSAGRGSTSLIGGGANFSSITHMSWTVSFSGASCSVNFGAVTHPGAWKIGYIVWYGDEVSASLQLVNCPTTTSIQAIAHGLGAIPSYAMVVGGRTVTGGGASGYVSVGHIDGTRQGVSSWQIRGTVPSAQPTVCKSYQVTDACCAILDKSSGAVIGEAEFVSWDATNIDLDWTTAPASAQSIVIAALSGVPAHVGTFTQPPASGRQLVSGLTVLPEVVLCQTVGKAASAAVQADARFSLGVSDTSTQFVLGNFDTDGATTTKTRRCSDTAAVLTSTPSAVTASATVSDMGALGVGDGYFGLEW
jgi:hypothetical protein